jgi:hypothetical protein
MNDLLPTPVTDTAFEVANTLNQTTKDGLTAFVSSILEGFRLFWHHPTVTPQELAAKFGTNCCALFDRHAAAVGFLLTLGVELDPADYTPPLPFVRNEDGTVTIG